MLSLTEFTNLWSNPLPLGLGFPAATIGPNDYHEYIIREIYHQDYLDLFCGAPTFNRVILGGNYYIQVTGNLLLGGLGIPSDPIYTLTIRGVEYIRVDYDYPWSGAELATPRRIQFIMVGEAPPPRALPGLVYPFGLLTTNTYFYNIFNTGSTAWLSAPTAAFIPSPLGIPSIPVLAPKRDKLLYLANNGYYLKDLFPFAIKFTTPTRTLLCTSGFAIRIFKDFLIPDLIRNLEIKAEQSNKFILAFSGPPKIHHFLANEINIGGIVLPAGINCRSSMNDTLPPTLPLPLLSWRRPWVPGNLINGVLPCLDTKIPFYRCCTYNSMIPIAGPKELFIRNAFL